MEMASYKYDLYFAQDKNTEYLHVQVFVMCKYRLLTVWK